MLQMKATNQLVEKKKTNHRPADQKAKTSLTLFAGLTIATALAALANARPVRASLGGDATTIEADRAKMQATVLSTSKDLYSVQEIHAPNNIVVREFLSPAGKVFAVAWEGPGRPDLQQLLGTYFDTFTKAAQAQKTHHTGRAPLSVQQSGLVVQMGGHARLLVGRAYVPQMVPSGVNVEEIR
jgi:hypothetical protein